MAPRTPRSSRPPRRGRPPEAERQARRVAALDAAVAEITEKGYASLTMLAVATRAGSSKESLYTWFGSKDGMVAEIIRTQAERTNAAVAAALGGEPIGEATRQARALSEAQPRSISGAIPPYPRNPLARDVEPRRALSGIAANLLLLLTSETSLALNRAATTSSELAPVLLRHGRHRTGPLIEGYLSRLAAEGVVEVDDVGAAFRLFYGLVVQDTQIRALLGERPPGPAALRQQAETAVEHFLRLVAPTAPGPGVATRSP